MAGLENTPKAELACWGSLGALGSIALGSLLEKSRGLGRVEGAGRVERLGRVQAVLRGDVGLVGFSKDPGSVACPGSIPPIVVPEAVKVRHLQIGGPSQFPPLKRRILRAPGPATPTVC